jgi:anti-sigma B factor antagonist
MTEPLHVELSYEGRSLCLALCGELTYGTAPILDEHLTQVFDSTRARLVLDVHGLQFCDSVGLSALIGAQRRADRAGGRMVLRGVHGMLERVLHITGAEVVFTVVRGDQVDRADRVAAANADRADELA